MRAYMHVPMRTHARAHTHTHTYTHTHTLAYMHARTHAHTQIHTHTRISELPRLDITPVTFSTSSSHMYTHIWQCQAITTVIDVVAVLMGFLLPPKVCKRTCARIPLT